ncbi:MAG: diacylglycerol kinase family protein [Eubacteriales bacterium]|jgi:undecaprenol kinase|nr:diacylglycerol kinase family protein [Eubacteriales bacterium]
MYKSKNLFESFKHAFSGMTFAFRNEKNFKIHFMAMIIAISLGLLFKLSTVRWVLLFLQIGMVISVEVINSAFERTVDLIVQDYNIEAKRIKDMAAGAVLVVSIVAVINGVLIFLIK